ncbi:MAG: YqgE/AlgH family protein [Turneriella sp.]|nr:YqgE/AlgH family protein [Turneriella sp.]
MDELMPLKGKLLIASSAILDGHFNKSIVLIVDHDARGSLGLVLNHLLPGDRQRRHPLFKGGPVDPDHRSLLHSSASLASDQAVIDGVYFESSDDLLSELAGEKLPYRRYAGYAGWATGQLEYELRTNSWVVIDARADLIFHDTDTDLWRRCLIEKGGLYRHFARTHKSIMLN